jgi:hypothetical protein
MNANTGNQGQRTTELVSGAGTGTTGKALCLGLLVSFSYVSVAATDDPVAPEAAPDAQSASVSAALACLSDGKKHGFPAWWNSAS